MTFKSTDAFYSRPAPFRRALLSWYIERDRSLPWREHWQLTQDPYGVWVSEIMLQQTLIKVVIPVFTRFMTAFPTLQDLAAASEDDVRREVRGLGYYRRFGFLHKAARQLATESVRGKILWPTSREEWLTLPGIGNYTASALASICLGEAAAVLDGNVERVLCRMLDWREPIGTPSLKKKLQPIADALLDARCAGDFNQAMMELGQVVCTKANPSCEVCPVGNSCLAQKRQSQRLAPAAKERRDVVEVKQNLCVVLFQDPKLPASDARVLLSRRDGASRFLKESWGFSEGSPEGEGASSGAVPLGSFSHSITHHKITVAVELYRVKSMAKNTDLRRWVPLGEVEPQLVANLDRKAWRLFEKHLFRKAKRRTLEKSSSFVLQ